MPTMMSARPRRAISSRIAGVRVVAGTSPPYHPASATGRRADGRPADRRVRVLATHEIGAVRGPVVQLPEAEAAPRDEREDRGRTDVGRDPDEERRLQHPVQEPLALEQRDV